MRSLPSFPPSAPPLPASGCRRDTGTIHAPASQAAGTSACAIPTVGTPDSTGLSAQKSPLISKLTKVESPAPIVLTTYCYCQINCSNGGWGQGYTELVECAQIFATCCNNSGTWSCT